MSLTPALYENEKVLIVIEKPDVGNYLVIQSTSGYYRLVHNTTIVPFKKFLLNGEETWVSPTDLIAKMFENDNINSITRRLNDGTVYKWERTPCRS